MFEEIRGKIAELLGIDESKITEGSNLITDLKADSMDVATLIMDLEELYGVEVEENDLDSLKTVGDIVKYISDRK